jgi:hypothetical protein
MKKRTLLSCMALCLISNIKAQWSPMATNIWNLNTGTVGIGTTTPNTSYKLHVAGSTRISNGTGYVDLLPAVGGVELGGNTLPVAFIDFKGMNYLSADYRARILYSDNNGLFFHTGANGTSRLFISDAGKVGIGTTTIPVACLVNINGGTRVSEGASSYFDILPWSGGLVLNSGQNAGYLDFKIPTTPANQFAARILYDATFGLNFFDTDGSSATMAIDDGSVAIGVVPKPAGYKLYVEGGILTEKVKVAVKTDAVNWSDYVFESDYKLLALDSVQVYTQQHKHLPGMPSAADVYKNGIDVAQMDALLLKQIEELWLQLMILKKENEALRNEINSSK